jgi:hypothetical protein
LSYLAAHLKEFVLDYTITPMKKSKSTRKDFAQFISERMMTAMTEINPEAALLLQKSTKNHAKQLAKKWMTILKKVEKRTKRLNIDASNAGPRRLSESRDVA